MPRLSERLPKLTVTLTQDAFMEWLKELAGYVEVIDKRELAETHRLEGQLDQLSERLDILEGKHKEQAPVDRRLVEETLEEALQVRRKLASGSWRPKHLVRLVDLLRRALEGESDDQD